MVISSSDEDEAKPSKKTIKDDEDDDFKPQEHTFDIVDLFNFLI